MFRIEPLRIQISNGSFTTLVVLIVAETYTFYKDFFSAEKCEESARDRHFSVVILKLCARHVPCAKAESPWMS